MSRPIHTRYVDPLAEVWLAAAARIGLAVTRTDAAYAATDGAGTLALGTDATLDADDSIAQMIFHELCHSLVEGKGSFERPDWGMDNVTEQDTWREHACLLTQWTLAGRHGLRRLLAPTTDYRAFWDALPADPLADRDEPSVQAAILALERAERAPWAPALDEALVATARIAAAVAAVPASARGQPPSMWAGMETAPTPHPTGLPPGVAASPAGDAARACGTCAWRYVGGPGRRTARCRQAGGDKIDDAWPGCERWEAAASLDCVTCGACCRAAYQSVELGRRDAFVKRHPAYVVDRGTYLEVKRDGDRCAALTVTPRVPGERATSYSCVVYDDRPRTCREFTLGSEHCLTARRRVGLSL